MKTLSAFALSMAFVGTAHAAQTLVCTANDNGKGVFIHQATVPAGNYTFNVTKGNYAFSGVAKNGNVVEVKATDLATGTVYESMSISENNLYLHVRFFEKSGKLLVYQCSFN